MEPVELSRINLSRLRPPVQRPGFDPTRITAGIVHLGLGGFHRAHMARYTHDLMERRADTLGWGIIGAGLMPADRRVHDSLKPQDNLYTLVERDAAQERVSVIASLADVIFAGESSTLLMNAIARPQTRILSLTVTEHGYCLNRATKHLDPNHPLIGEDLTHPERPSSAIGIIVEAYRRRRESGVPPFTALSCDNIQHNGDVLREAVLALASLRDGNLANWIEENASFPSTMVDRITPVTAEKDIATLAERYGIIDRWPVFCETFTQWVIEDRFPTGRPAWRT
jgi:mannitol 2-dehydrogenase